MTPGEMISAWSFIAANMVFFFKTSNLVDGKNNCK